MGAKHDLEPSVVESIERVGIKNFRTMFNLIREGQAFIHLPVIDIFLDVPAKKKGLHMSRLQMALQKVSDSIEGKETFEQVGRMILENIKHPFFKAEITIKSELAVREETPKSKFLVWEVHQVRSTIFFDKKVDNWEKKIGVTVIGNSVCCCTGHMQRSIIDIDVVTDFDRYLTFESLIDCAQNAFSSRVHSIVRTIDEEYMTEKMKKNPKFVEDLVRDTFKNLKKNKISGIVKIQALSNDSIHRHDVYAELKRLI